MPVDWTHARRFLMEGGTADLVWICFSFVGFGVCEEFLEDCVATFCRAVMKGLERRDVAGI